MWQWFYSANWSHLPHPLSSPTAWLEILLLKYDAKHSPHISCHSRRSTGVNDNMNNGWIRFSCCSLRALVYLFIVSLSRWDARWNKTIFHALTNTCVFPVMTGQNVKATSEYLWMAVPHLRTMKDRQRWEDKQRRLTPAVFCIWLANESLTVSQFFMENMLFCELFSPHLVLFWVHSQRTCLQLCASSPESETQVRLIASLWNQIYR